MDEIKQENIVRIYDKKLLERLNKMYAERKGIVYTSKNNFLNDILQIGIQTFEKQEKDNWAIQNEKQTLLDAIHEHTKRMNYFIKFSKPFIKSTYANCEITQKLLTILFNDFLKNKTDEEQSHLMDDIEKESKLLNYFEKMKKELLDVYDYKVEVNEKKKEPEVVQADQEKLENLQKLNDEILQLQKMLDDEQ